jgi:hypothetical protein
MSDYEFTPEQRETIRAAIKRMTAAVEALKAANNDMYDATREAKTMSFAAGNDRIQKAMEAVWDAEEEHGSALIRYTLDQDPDYLQRVAKRPPLVPEEERVPKRPRA